MQSRTTRQFWRLFSELSFDVQREAKRAYRLFRGANSSPLGRVAAIACLASVWFVQRAFLG